MSSFRGTFSTFIVSISSILALYNLTTIIAQKTLCLHLAIRLIQITINSRNQKPQPPISLFSQTFDPTRTPPTPPDYSLRSTTSPAPKQVTLLTSCNFAWFIVSFKLPPPPVAFWPERQHRLQLIWNMPRQRSLNVSSSGPAFSLARTRYKQPFLLERRKTRHETSDLA